MTGIGTSLPLFKVALFDRLRTQLPNSTRYEAPVDTEGLLGDDGSGLSIFFPDEPMEAELDVVVAPLQRYDERVAVKLVIQALGVTTDDTQEVLDARANDALGVLLDILLTDPAVGITTTERCRNFRALITGWTYELGMAGKNQRAAGFRVDIGIASTLHVTG